MTALTAGHLIEARVKYERFCRVPLRSVARFMVDHLMDAVIVKLILSISSRIVYCNGDSVMKVGMEPK